jgi:outer membrane protein assembly factor BamD
MRKIFFIIPLFFLACSTKQEVSNLTALSWHKKIQKDIASYNLDAADNDFMSLNAEHPTSIYLKRDTLILFLAHLQIEDYELAKFYLNQYKKQFATSKELPWIDYELLKISFLMYKNPYTNQDELNYIIAQAKNYINSYPNSKYIYQVNTILQKAILTKKYFNDKISNLYKKLNKPKAAKLYKTKIPKNSKPPYIPWYKKIFYW